MTEEEYDERESTMTTTADIIARLSVGDGATIDAATGEPISEGYAVATNMQLRIPEACLAAFMPTVESFITTARGRYPVLGSWRAHGFREFAVSNVIDDREDAIVMACLMSEEAIFDLAAGVEIPVR